MVQHNDLQRFAMLGMPDGGVQKSRHGNKYRVCDVVQQKHVHPSRLPELRYGRVREDQIGTGWVCSMVYRSDMHR